MSHSDQDARSRLLAGIPARQHEVLLAGVATAVLEGGDGPPVVLLHGPGGSATHWLRVLPQLMDSHRVIAPDLPGLGSSEVIEGALDPDRVLSWLGDLIEGTCSSPPALVGNALGGAIATRFACEHGDRLRALVPVDSLGLSSFRPAPGLGAALGAFLTDPTPATHEGLWRQCASDLDGLRSRMAGLWDAFEAYNVDRATTPSVQAALGSLMEEFGMPAIPPERLAEIAVPTTLIWGRNDSAVPLEIAERASSDYGWALEVVEGCAADPHLERPEAFLGALRIALSSEVPA